MSPIVLTGLDGSNPLGFLAGLGVLNTLADRGGRPTLSWQPGVWHAVVEDDTLRDRDALIAALVQDRATWSDEGCLALKYTKGKKASAWDLKPPPGRFRSYLIDLVSRSEPGCRREVDFAASFATESARDNNGNTKPTALHFTAGQQEFLGTVGELRNAVTPADLKEAVFGPWRYARKLKILGWDCTAARVYALRSDDPSKADKLGVPGADWLAFRGLSFLPVVPRGQQILTTGCSGGWKTGQFCWPLWNVDLTRMTVRAVLQTPALAELPERTRRARGISAVFASAIRRSDQGGYGSFAPAMAL